MAITFNIPSDIWVLVLGTGDIGSFGNFVSQKESVLRNIKVGIFKNNCTGKFRIRLHTSRDFNTNYAVSNWVDIEDIQDLLFVGNVRFDFNKCVLSKNKLYYVTIESIDYIRNADVSYMSFIYDSPMTTNVSTGDIPSDFPIRMEIFHK